MDRMQRQAIGIIIDSIEKQLAGLKGLVMIVSQSPNPVNTPRAVEETDSMRYTSKEDDARIKDLTDPGKEFQDEKEKFLTDLFRDELDGK